MEAAEKFGQFIGLVLFLAICGGFIWALATGAWFAIFAGLVIAGLFGAVLKVAGWGLS